MFVGAVIFKVIRLGLTISMLLAACADAISSDVFSAVYNQGSRRMRVGQTDIHGATSCGIGNINFPQTEDQAQV